MYRKDVLKDAGVTMPERPTWTQVADIARKVNSPDMAGICLRGKPGWGDLGAALTTVLNTFGGTWWSAKPDGSVDQAQVDQPEFKQALDFYVTWSRTPARRTPPTRASTSACRSTRTARSPCGTTPPWRPACWRRTTAP